MEIINVNYLGSTPEFQEYSDKDLSLVNFNIISRNFGSETDYIEYSIYDLNNNLLSTNYNVNTYTIKGVDPINNENNTIFLNPDQDVRNEGFDRGAVNITYNFFRKLFNSSDSSRFWISDISTDRTELRVFRQDLSNDELQILFNEYNVEASSKNYYQDFYLNFGDNTLLIGVNVLYALSNEQASLLIKLYEPLPDIFSEKDTFWLVDKISEPATYNIDIEIPAESIITRDNLQGPNFNINVSERVGQTTNYISLGSIFNNSVSSSYRQLKSLVDEKGYDINVDYTDFNNFIHFSSAVERVTNFAYKIQLIESYNSDISSLNNITGNTNTISSSISLLQNKIDDIVEKFDGYEYYLYFDSESSAWPKSNSTKPYNLYSYTSSQVSNWLGGINTVPTATTQSILFSASIYDLNNKDWLLNTVPAYLKEDPNNEPYQIFLSMIGQHFDNIWIYVKDITNRYNAENSLDKGISKDEVADALRSLGLKLYTNTNISDNIFYSLIGVGPEGENLPPTGSEVITTYVTSSAETIPADDITSEYYKRLYHNLPYILKNKGTSVGLRALINCFGIPDTILRINEFGGSDKLATTPDLIQDDYTVSLYNSGSSFISIPWGPSNFQYLSSSYGNVVPDTIEFSFRNINGIPSASYYTQSLFQVGSGSNFLFGANLQYDPSTSILGNNNQYYGDIRFYISGTQGFEISDPISLPYFDSDLWWTLMIKREVGGVNALNNGITNTYSVNVKNSLYNYNGGTNPGFAGSSSVIIDGSMSSSYNSNWNSYDTSSYSNFFNAFLGGNDNNGVMSPNGVRYQGLLRDFRYYAEPISESVLNIHSQNLNSYVGNDPTSSQFSLIYRIPLGNELDFPSGSQTIIESSSYDGGLVRKYNITKNTFDSYHPAISGTFLLHSNGTYLSNIGSFITASQVISFASASTVQPLTFISEQRYNLIATPSTGLNQKVNNKVNTPVIQELTSSLLSKDISIQVFNDNISRNSFDIEVGFSPADVISEDIANQLGYFNIDEYIGSPNDQYQDTYQDLSQLRKTYFQKYQSAFKIWDFVRLLKYYDNSLFKMIKDFVPARANLSTGVIVKPHILERSKYKRNEPTVERYEYTGSIDTAFITGTNPEGEDINTDYSSFVTCSLGYLPKNNNDKSQPFTGEFGGSEIFVTNGEFLDYETSNIITDSTAGYVTYSLQPLLNNVSSSRKSNTILDIDYSSNPSIPVNNGLITGAFDLYDERLEDPNSNPLQSQYWPFAEIEDSQYNLYSYTNPRYEGSRNYSANYNNYTAPNSNYSGDSSYGKTAAVDHYVKKIGLFTQIESSSFFLNRNNVSLTYLIDQDGNYTNLDENNTNWQEFQNTFKNSPVTVNLFDSKQYSNQKFTNGPKPLYNSGYRYEPVFYFKTGSGEDISASFDYSGETLSQIFNNLPFPGNITTSSNATYQAVSSSLNPGYFTVPEIFRASGRDGEYNDRVFTLGQSGSLRDYSVFQPPATNNYSFNTNFKLFVDFGTGGSGAINFIYRVSKFDNAATTVLENIQKSFTGGQYYRISQFNLFKPGYNYAINSYGNEGSVDSNPAYEIKIFDISGNLIKQYNDAKTFFKYDVTYTPISTNSNTGKFGRLTPEGEAILDRYDPTGPTNYLRQSFTQTIYKVEDIYVTLNLNVSNEITLTDITSTILEFNSSINDELLKVGADNGSNGTQEVKFELLIQNTGHTSGLNTPGVTVSLLDGGNINNNLKGSIPIAIRPFVNFDTTNDNIILTGSIANLYGGSFAFLPSSSLYQSSSLYSLYGDVNYSFALDPGDLIVINTQSGSVSSEYNVISQTKINNNTVNIRVSPALPESINAGTLYSVVFLKKLADETNMYLNFKKRPGKTSYGLVIPQNIDPVVLQNIDQISKEIQTKLLTNQSNLLG